MSLRTVALLLSLRLTALLLSGCAADANSPESIAARYATLKHQEKYTEASALATPNQVKSLQWISEQKSKQTASITEPWTSIETTPKKAKIDGDLATVGVVVEGSYRQTPHWCIGEVELQRLEDTWKVEDSSMPKCGFNSLPPK